MKGAKPRFFSLQEGMYNGHLWHFSEVNNGKSYKFLMYANNTELINGRFNFCVASFCQIDTSWSHMKRKNFNWRIALIILVCDHTHEGMFLVNYVCRETEGMVGGAAIVQEVLSLYVSRLTSQEDKPERQASKQHSFMVSLLPASRFLPELLPCLPSMRNSKL